MYNNKFVVSVKHKGKIMREVGDVVYIPFGSDYSVLLKNQNTMKAVVDIKIDGMDVIDGNSVIIEPNNSLELKGFMENRTVRNKFRFIEKTKKIYNFRGSRIDDGIIRVEYRFERDYVPNQCVIGFVPYRSNPNPTSSNFPTKYGSCSTNSVCKTKHSNDNGITVRGDITRQDFTIGKVGSLEDTPSVITILLKGREKTTNKFVNKMVTVKTRIACTTCGTMSKSSAKFCRECGTFLGKYV